MKLPGVNSEMLCHKGKFELQCRRSLSIPPALKDMLCASTQEDQPGYREDFWEGGSVADVADDRIPFQMGLDYET